MMLSGLQQSGDRSAIARIRGDANPLDDVDIVACYVPYLDSPDPTLEPLSQVQGCFMPPAVDQGDKPLVPELDKNVDIPQLRPQTLSNLPADGIAVLHPAKFHEMGEVLKIQVDKRKWRSRLRGSRDELGGDNR